MDDIRLIIRERYDRMSKGERQLSDFILEAPSQILNMTAAEIAEASGVSSATVVRYVKKLGAEKAVTAVRKARKIYILGMGTLDAVELTPTYSVPPERAFGLLAGGDKAKAAEVLEKTGGRVREAIKLAE